MEDFLSGLDAWVWRYRENTRNYPGLHFTARESACERLIQGLDLLMAEGVGSRRTIPLRSLAPTDEAKISGGQRFVSLGKLVLQFSAVTANLQQLCVGYADRRAVVALTPASIQLLRQGFKTSGTAMATTRSLQIRRLARWARAMMSLSCCGSGPALAIHGPAAFAQSLIQGGLPWAAELRRRTRAELAAAEVREELLATQAAEAKG